MELLERIKSSRSLQLILLAGGILLMVVILLLLVQASQQHLAVRDNHTLSSKEKTTQETIQDYVTTHPQDSSSKQNTTTSTDTILLNKILVTSGNWQLVQVNYASSRDNYGYVVLDGQQVTLGPTTDLPLADLVKQRVPDQIIDYLYPTKPQWVGFEGTEFSQNRANIQACIETWAKKSNIKLNRVVKTSSINRTTLNPRTQDEAERLEFEFSVNHDDTSYILSSTYTLATKTYIYAVNNASGDILYSYSIGVN